MARAMVSMAETWRVVVGSSETPRVGRCCADFEAPVTPAALSPGSLEGSSGKDQGLNANGETNDAILLDTALAGGLLSLRQPACHTPPADFLLAASAEAAKGLPYEAAAIAFF
jgi:hypothetical protein